MPKILEKCFDKTDSMEQNASSETSSKVTSSSIAPHFMEPQDSLPRSPYPARLIQSMLINTISLESILILYFNDNYVFRWSILFTLSNQKCLRTSHLTMYTTCPAHLIPRDSITIIIACIFEITNYEAPHHVNVSSLFILLR